MSKLFEPVALGVRTLANRIAMAPMTRARNPDGIANDLNALYYRQRTSAGLIVTEGTPISPSAEGFLSIPGLYTQAQVLGWRTRERAEQMIEEGLIDIAAFGEPFIANPDLVERLRNGWPLSPADRSLHYGGGAHGYTDYLTYSMNRSAA